MAAHIIVIEPRFYDRESGFVIAAFAILMRIRIWRGGALLFPQRPKDQLSIKIVAFLIRMTNDFAECGAILLANLDSFLWIESVTLRGARVAAARHALDFDPSSD